MNEKQQKLCRQLDRAIDAGELAEVDRILAQLDSLAAKTIEAEDQALFAARIKGMGKEHLSMNKKSMRTVLIAAALVVVGGPFRLRRGIGWCGLRPMTAR